MLVLSFDIGIKNLAYCLLNVEKKFEGKLIHHSIIKWNIINMCETKELNCNFEQKNKKICGKKAFFSKDNNNYYCKLHSKNIDGELKDLSIRKCHLFGKKSKCKRNASYYKNDLEVCTGCYKKQKDKSDFYKIQKTGKANIDQDFFTLLSKKLDDELDDELEVIPDFVILENQPAFKNPRMKSVQIFLFTYFFMKHRNTQIKIEFFNAGKKLEVYEGEILQTGKTGYANTKALGIKYANEIIKKEKSDFPKDYLSAFKKKDDLADAYLQGLQYLYSHQKIYI